MADQLTNTNILNVRIKNKVVALGSIKGSVVLNLTRKFMKRDRNLNDDCSTFFFFFVGSKHVCTAFISVSWIDSFV